MNRTKNYFTGGLWIFFVLLAVLLAAGYAAQTDGTVLMFGCLIAGILLSLGLLAFLLQANKALGENWREIDRLEERIATLTHQEQKTEDDYRQHVEVFRANEMLARIMPAAGTQFKSAADFTEKILQNVAKELNIVQGLVFVLNDADRQFHISGEYAYFSEEQPRSFPLGETLSGQVAKNRKMMSINELPDGYITVLSGLGKSNPHHLIIAPIVHGDASIGIMELASFKPFGDNEETLVSLLSEAMADLLNELRTEP
jgi:transcriptional regulator with GAF, ATPase, and Fis domain